MKKYIMLFLFFIIMCIVGIKSNLVFALFISALLVGYFSSKFNIGAKKISL